MSGVTPGGVPRRYKEGMTPSISAVILAAGQGSRMVSARPKPLHVLCGKAMVLYLADAVVGAGIDRVVVVVGPDGEQITKKVQAEGPDVLFQFVEQQTARGSGDAAGVALTAYADDDLDDDDDVLVLPGDMPLLRADTLARLVAHHRSSVAAATVLTVPARDGDGLGRVLTGRNGQIVAVADPLDVDPEAPEPDRSAAGVYCFRRSLLAPAVRRISPENRQGAYRLGDTIDVLARAGHPVADLSVEDPAETLGVNDRLQLAAVEAEIRRRTNLHWLARGVTMLDPSTTYLDTTVELAPDVTLFPGVILQGMTVVGEGAEIGSGCRLVDCAVGARSRVDNTVARDAEIGPDAVVGPYALLDPGSQVPAGHRTGPFFHLR